MSVNSATEAAHRLVESGWQTGMQPSTGATRRRVAIGDPQTTCERFFDVLNRHGLLGADGYLRTDVSLLSVGDHFDFPAQHGCDPRETGLEGTRILSWLAAHPPDRVPILLGNHDTSRVQELATLSDPEFAEGRRAAALIEGDRARDGRSPEVVAAAADFAQRFPAIPTPQLAHRDYSSFTTGQRRLMQQLLLSGRMQLAQAARLSSGELVLITHAGITTRELQCLGMESERDPRRIADALNDLLASAVRGCAAAWERGELRALDLAPLHFMGTTGKEGGGMLYHRPVNPLTAKEERMWEAVASRRFHPRCLPDGLTQACGHVGHSKCLEQLQGWIDGEIAPGDLRSLIVDGDQISYGPATRQPPAGAAVLIMIDGSIHSVESSEYELLELAEWL